MKLQSMSVLVSRRTTHTSVKLRVALDGRQVDGIFSFRADTDLRDVLAWVHQRLEALGCGGD